MQQVYAYLKCKKCNRIHPGGTVQCSCGTALAVYGVPCNRQGVEQERPDEKQIPVNPGVEEIPEPEPPVRNENWYQTLMRHLTSFWFYMLLGLCAFLWIIGESVMNTAELDTYYMFVALPVSVLTCWVAYVKFLKNK